jgi:glycosyltransferase 2 family protein
MLISPGPLGEVMRPRFLERNHGYRYDGTAALLIADRLVVVRLVLRCAFGLAAFDGFMPERSASIGLVAAVLVGLAEPVPAPRSIKFAYGIIGRWLRFFAAARSALHHRSIRWLCNGLPLHQAVFIFASSMLARGIQSVSWLLSALGADLSVTGAISMLPSGLGSTETTIIGLLVLCRLPSDLTVAAKLIVRATTLWLAFGLGDVTLSVSLRLACAQGRA